MITSNKPSILQSSFTKLQLTTTNYKSPITNYKSLVPSYKLLTVWRRRIWNLSCFDKVLNNMPKCHTIISCVPNILMEFTSLIEVHLVGLDLAMALSSMDTSTLHLSTVYRPSFADLEIMRISFSQV